MVTADEFRSTLRSVLDRAQRNGHSVVEVDAGKLHRMVGGYPPERGETHSMPNCCQVMKSEMHDEDIVVAAPPSGQGASLTLRYKLPRQ